MARFFRDDEFKCPCCGESNMDEDFIERLDGLRAYCNFPFVITSGYRCPAHNAEVSSTGNNGPHTLGKAADIQASGERAYDLITLARSYGFTGIGMAKTFVHLDTCTKDERPSRPTAWPY